MKKTLVLFLAVTLLLSACQFSGPDNSNEGSSVEQGGSSVVKEPAENDPAGDDLEGDSLEGDSLEANDASEVSEQSLPLINIESINVQRYTEDGETLIVEITRDNMTLSGDGYEKAADAVRKLFYYTEEELSAQADDLVEDAMDQYMATKDSITWFTPYGSNTSYGIARLDTNVLSVNATSYEFTGGAHGYGAEWGTVIDLKNGTELTLSQLAEDAPSFMNKIQEFVLADLSGRQEEEELFDAYESYVEQNLEETSFYLDATGIVLVYTPYEIGPYSSGSISVQVPYEEVAEYMKAEYLPA